MDPLSRIEQALSAAIAQADAPGCPPVLHRAMHASIFPRGARIRPRLCLAVAAACGEDRPALTDSAAASIELLHGASLVHDDLPAFDDADTRRGRPTIHRAFGEPIAVLAGDALIVLAFQILAEAAVRAPARLAPLVRIVGASVGVPRGIAAGQAWECEHDIDLAEYQREKTGALFAAATMAGAAASGMESQPWQDLGLRLGEAYQVADDIRDFTCTEAELGKPVHQDEAHHRPNAVAQLGLGGAIDWLDTLAEAAAFSIPPCPGQAALRSHILSETRRLLPPQLSRSAA